MHGADWNRNAGFHPALVPVPQLEAVRIAVKSPQSRRGIRQANPPSQLQTILRSL